MAQDISLLGASFSDVPAITLPKTGGGTAKFTDVTDTTATASDVAQGKAFYDASGVLTQGTASGGGGGGGSATAKAVNFYDADGNIVNSYSRTEALALTDLPSNPTKTGLTAQGWNWKLTSIKSYLTKYPDAVVNVGQMFITDDGKTRLYVHFEDERCSPYLQLYPNGTVVIDWGDNSATSTLTGTSLTAIKNVQHVYAHGGDYVITLTVTGTARIQGSSSSGNGSYLLQKASGTSSTYVSQVYRNAVRKIEIGSGIEIYNQAFWSMYSLESITIPRAVTSIGTYAFYTCYSLASITIPDGVTSIGNSAFSSCYSLASIAIPDGVTSIPTSMFSSCYSLASLTIPEDVADIAASTFAGCYGMAEYHFLPTTPPTLANANTFNNIPSDCIIYVPVGSLEAYQTATNWTGLASKMREEGT